jgi:hypothetical protein
MWIWTVVGILVVVLLVVVILKLFEPDWARALYLTKGAVGVRQKVGAHFSVWAVCDFP